MTDSPRLEMARRQIEFARDYTRSLLDGLSDEDWFRRPPGGGVTHIGWQVGHLAMAEYMLVLFRLRGKLPEDESLISKAFLRRFVKGSTPEPDPAKNPSPAELRMVFDRVHRQVLEELAGFPDEELDEPVVEPYAAYNTRLGSLLFCAAHEMLHAGQIGLIRRLLGKPPLR